MDIKLMLASVGINAVAMLGGIVGGTVSVIMKEDHVSFRQGVYQIFVGAVAAGYGAGHLGGWWRIENITEVEAFLGLVLGLTGMQVAKSIQKIAAKYMSKFEDNPDALIQSQKKPSPPSDHDNNG